MRGGAGRKKPKQQNLKGKIKMHDYSINMPALQFDGDPFERYAAGDPGYFGDLVRHNGKIGGWSTGVANDPIQLGTSYVAIYEEAYVGFVLWVDAKPTQALLPLRSNPDLKALRNTLGDLDPSLWTERTADGKPKDPWQESVLLPLIHRETLEGSTFSTSNGGGVKAFRHLIRVCVAEKRGSPETTNGCFPLIELGETSYRHQKYGEIFNPVLTLVDWVPAHTIAPTLQMLGVRLPAIEHTTAEVDRDDPQPQVATDMEDEPRPCRVVTEKPRRTSRR
jgi:hypothetical protein